MTRRELLLLAAVAAAAAATGGVVGALALQKQSGAAELLASAFPDLSGRMRRLSEWQGRAFLCNFWASWCAPCREEMPLLDAAPIQVVGIAVDNARNVGDYLKTVRIRFPILVAGADGLDLMRQLGNRSGALPYSVVLDSAGRLRSRRLGPYSPSELATELAGLSG